MEVPPVNPVYQCPDEGYPISREVHLGRLSAFYPKCRGCPHRHDTGAMSRRLVEKLGRMQRQATGGPQFSPEGLVGVYLNEITPVQVRDFAAAYGLLRQRAAGPNPADVLIAGDGRPLTLELVAAAGEGLRWSGCHVIELGIATAPCLISAICHLNAAGGVMVGNPTGDDHIVGVKLWDANGRPLASDGELNDIYRLTSSGLDRAGRSAGRLDRFHGDPPYLGALRGYFHALRPLRFVIDTPCRPLIDYLRQLLSNVACEALLYRNASNGGTSGLAERVKREQAHLGISIDGNAESCRLIDERGQVVPTHAFLTLIALDLLASQPGAAVVLENNTPAFVGERLAAAGARVIFSSALRSEMYAMLLSEQAALGGAAGGRIWFGGATPAPDALLALSHLLRCLSRNDWPLSDAVSAAGGLTQSGAGNC